jgi:hypothetical protein
MVGSVTSPLPNSVKRYSPFSEMEFVSFNFKAGADKPACDC